MDKTFSLAHPEVAFVWYVTDSGFRQIHRSLIKDVDWGEFDWSKALAYAHANYVLYWFCGGVLKRRIQTQKDIQKKLLSVVSDGEQSISRLRKTLMTIKDLWDGNVEYYVIKTRDDRPTYDVDVLLLDKADYELAISIAQNRGFRFTREEPFKGWIGVEDGTKIELHHRISWFGTKIFEDDFLGKTMREVKLMRMPFPTIGKEVEGALDLAHWVMDIQPLTIKDFSNLVGRAQERNCIKETIDQAGKLDWLKSLVYHLSVLRELSKLIYRFELQLPIEYFHTRINLDFPFWMPLHIKGPSISKKIIVDNNGFMAKMNMLQLAIRRYTWERLRELVSH